MTELLLNTVQVARRLGISTQALQQLIDARKFPEGVFYGHSGYGWPEDDVQDYWVAKLLNAAKGSQRRA